MSNLNHSDPAPSPPNILHDSIKNLAGHLVKYQFSNDSVQVVGLGSGSTVAGIVKEMSKSLDKITLEFIATSLQIKQEAEKNGLKIVDENRIPNIDIVIDGADQIDSRFYMIKGGGGALLKEKVLISAAKRVVIIADSNKFVNEFSSSIPIEVHPFARSIVWIKLQEAGGIPKLRTVEKGYPFITENGNIIYDTSFNMQYNVPANELNLKNIPGVVEVGLFTRRADVYYKAKSDGSFEVTTL
ncbi:MAG: ribose 5-phosphate isomerase A [Thermoproteota archaeon]|nr:ribose 5-phosphate isomerase A [Thermoproteota archaeon]